MLKIRMRIDSLSEEFAFQTQAVIDQYFCSYDQLVKATNNSIDELKIDFYDKLLKAGCTDDQVSLLWDDLLEKLCYDIWGYISPSDLEETYCCCPF